MNRALLIGAFALSSLPFSLTASAWQNGNFGLFLWIFVIAQAMLMGGFVRHAMRPGVRENFEGQLEWARRVQPGGVILLLVTQVIVGIIGWAGSLQFGFLPAGIAASLLTLGLVWASTRSRVLNPVRAHWVKPAYPWLDGMYRNIWGLYRALGRVSSTITEAFEGAGGVMWTLLFLVLFISLMTQGTR